jgi:hypothetical protein
MTLRLIAVAAALGTVGALAACGGSNNPSPQQSAGPDETVGGHLGEADGPSASTTGTSTTPPPPPVTPPPVPDSTVPSKVGYVWGYDSTMAVYVAAGSYNFNSSGGPITITRQSAGKYFVSFAGLADPGGVAHAQAYGSNNYCNIDSWSPVGPAQNVYLSCRNPAGTLTDSQFVASFASGRMGKARFSYLWANDASTAAKYAPDSGYAYDAIDSAGLSVQRTGTGKYDVYIPAGGPNLPNPWTVQVTAYATDARCKLASYSESSRTAQVNCRTPAGALVDARFSLTFASDGSAVGRTDRKYGFYADNEGDATNTSTGQYAVKAAGNGGSGGQVMVTARSGDSTYCVVGGWGVNGADMTITIRCYDPSGAPVNGGFEVALTL